MSTHIHHSTHYHHHHVDRTQSDSKNGSSHNQQHSDSFLKHGSHHSHSASSPTLYAGTNAAQNADTSGNRVDAGNLNVGIQEIRQLMASLQMMIQNGDDSNYTDPPNSPDSSYAADSSEFEWGQQGMNHAIPLSTPRNGSMPTQSQANNTTATQGTTVNYNPFFKYSDQCTYGAENLVLRETGGKGLDVTGDAKQWDTQAKNAGYTVVNNNPTPGSVAVFQPNSQLADGEYGHVAVVVSVDQQKHTAEIEEMNNPVLGGPGLYNFRQIRTDNIAGTDFIEIPQSDITNPLSSTQTVAA